MGREERLIFILHSFILVSHFATLYHTFSLTNTSKQHTCSFGRKGEVPVLGQSPLSLTVCEAVPLSSSPEASWSSGRPAPRSPGTTGPSASCDGTGMAACGIRLGTSSCLFLSPPPPRIQG